VRGPHGRSTRENGEDRTGGRYLRNGDPSVEALDGRRVARHVSCTAVSSVAILLMSAAMNATRQERLTFDGPEPAAISRIVILEADRVVSGRSYCRRSSAEASSAPLPSKDSAAQAFEPSSVFWLSCAC